MEWSDRGIVLSSRPHGETGLVTTLLTRAAWPPRRLRRRRHLAQVAADLAVRQRRRGRVARQQLRAARQLHRRIARAHAARVMDDAVELAGLSAACGLIDAALPDREPHAAIFDGFHALLNAIGHPGWPMIYVRLELGLLQELGFGLDLDKCAVTGVTEDLAFVSPKTGRAVSRTAAEPYRDRLIALPAFLSTGGLPADAAELRLGLDLTGYFLEHHVFWPHNKPLPAARSRFMETLSRQEQHS
jgi:DNA repair protein RecO (recombination protein O)